MQVEDFTKNNNATTLGVVSVSHKYGLVCFFLPDYFHMIQTVLFHNLCFCLTLRFLGLWGFQCFCVCHEQYGCCLRFFVARV